MVTERTDSKQGQNPDAPQTPTATEQQAATQVGNLPPLHPIFERLSQALNQQASERLRKEPPPELPVFPRLRESALASQRDPVALEKFKQRRAYQAEWMRNKRRRQKEAQMREETGASSDPSVMPPAPESTTLAKPRRIRGGKNP